MRQGRVCVDAHAARASRGRARFTRSMHSRVTCTMMLHINIGTCTGHTHAHTRARARARTRAPSHTLMGARVRLQPTSSGDAEGAAGLGRVRSGPGQVWAGSGVGRVRCGPVQVWAGSGESGRYIPVGPTPVSLPLPTLPLPLSSFWAGGPTGPSC